MCMLIDAGGNVWFSGSHSECEDRLTELSREMGPIDYENSDFQIEEAE